MFWQLIFVSTVLPCDVYIYDFLRVIAQSGLSLKDKLPGGNNTLGEALMAPTVIYVKQVCNELFILHHNVFCCCLTRVKSDNTNTGFRHN